VTSACKLLYKTPFSSDKYLNIGCVRAVRGVSMGESSSEEKPEKPIGKEVGKVDHYYSKLSVAVVDITDDAGLKPGDKIRIKGATTDFEQEVKSMQVDHKEIEDAKKGQSIGMKVSDHVRQNDKVYKV